MNTNNLTRLRAAGILVASVFGVTALIFGIFPAVFQSWDRQTVDQLFVLREKLHPSPYDSSIVHIDIDNSSIKELSYYFPRRLHADLFDVTRRMEFAAIAYDIIFAGQQNIADDTLLLAAAARSGNVYVPVAFALDDTHAYPRLGKEEARYLDSTAWMLNAEHVSGLFRAGATLMTWPALSRRAHGAGFISVEPDADGVFRRVPLVIRYKEMFYPSLTFRLACDRLRVLPNDITIDGGTSIVLHHATVRDGTQHDIVIPIDAQGNMLINWIGSWERMKHISFAAVLRTAEDRDEVDAYAERYRGSIGIVGDVSTGMSDIGPIPFDQDFPLVGLHANVLNTILTENFLSQLSVPSVILIEAVLLTLMIFFSYRFSSSVYTAASLGLLLAYVTAGCGLFLFGNTIAPLIQPALAIILSTGSVLTHRHITEERAKEQLRARFESYFPPAVVKQMMDNPGMRTTTPRCAELTIMFSDIKSFTTHSSVMSPEAISESLSEYFEAMTEIVFKFDGTVDKFMGDGLMVFYGAPEQQQDHAVRCVRAAIEMQKKCRELKAAWCATGRFPLQIRIGINTGPVIVGDLGSERRKEYTVLGSDVNLAQRLESNAPVEGILITERTYRQIKDAIETRPRDPIMVKGLTTPIAVYEVVVA